MAQSWNIWCWHLGLASSLAISYALASSSERTTAQITPDATLGADRSVVTSFPDQPVDVLSGGVKSGANLFHSFREFNVAAGRGAYFYSPSAEIQNILARVTGSNRSEILGLIGTYGESNPNLFLINPNGIIFGPNASLDVGGSFVASTASSVNFADGTEFNATANPTTPLLTVSVPMGLQFRGTLGGIRVQGAGLAVQPGKTLALVGGNVALEGGYVYAEGGRIELGSVVGPSLISLKPTDFGWALGYEGAQNFQDIQLSQQALVNASGKGGGDIQVQGRHITLTDTSRIYADTVRQNGGEISIHASELIVRDGSQISASTLGVGQGGTLTVTASDSVELSGTATTSDGTFPSSLFAQTENTGNAGALTITTGQLIVRNGAQVSAGTSTDSTGQGGSLTVNASDSVELSGAVETPNRQITSGLFAQTQGIGNAGSLTITTGKLIAQDGGQVAAGAGIGSQGKGGSLTITASDEVELSGTAPNPQDTSGLFARTRGIGDAGNLTIATGQLIVRDGAQVTVSGVKSGDAGNLEVRARNLLIDNFGAIVAETAAGVGGNITLLAQDLLLMRNNSRISTTAGTTPAGGDGGNITINTPFIVAVPSEDSDIRANAYTGKGGKIQIAASGIFGIQRRERDTPVSNITASSQLGVNGVVEINTPDVDPSLGLVANPAELVDASGLIASGCGVGGSQAQSEFILTGRGGLPDNPSDPLSSDTIWTDLRPRTELAGTRPSSEEATQQTNSTPGQLVEATGWVINNFGEVVLTAIAPTATPHSPWMNPATCHTPEASS